MSGTVTYVVLSMAANAGKRHAQMTQSEPDYVRYASMGYSFDTVTSKKNVLLSLTDSGQLCRAHLMCFDVDKHTLDVVEIPVSAELEVDDFSGTLEQAYETGVYRDIVSHALMIKIDVSAEMDTQALSDCVSAVGGVSIDVDKPVNLGKYTLSDGKRKLTGSVAQMLANDGAAYSENRLDSALAYRQFFASALDTLDRMGGATWFSKLLDIIVNEVKSDADINEMIELVNLFNSVNMDKTDVFMFPGQALLGVFAADKEQFAQVLNEHFRVKDVEVPADELGFKNYDGVLDSFDGVAINIRQILT